MNFVDTHCHIHTGGYKLDAHVELSKAETAGVVKVVVVGEGAEDSQDAVNFAKRNQAFVSVGIHPHMADTKQNDLKEITEMILSAKDNRIIAIGECGLDYYYLNSNKQSQEQIFRDQIELAVGNNLPLIFHVRGSKDKPNDAFDDFFHIVDEYPNLRGVVHSFSNDWLTAEKILERNLYIGLNGIITFSTSEGLAQTLQKLPLSSVLLETDSPYLTPVPFRGRINSPQYVVEVGKHLAKIKEEDLEKIADVTTINASELFNI